MKFVVIAGYWDNETKIIEYSQCIGVYDSAREAYGEALLYINDEIDVSEKDTVKISPLYELDMEAGYGMRLEGGNRTYTDFVNVYFYDDKEDVGKHTCEET